MSMTTTTTPAYPRTHFGGGGKQLSHMMSGRPGGGGKQIRTMAPMTDCGYSRKKIRVALLWSTSEKRKIWASCVYRTSNTYSKCCLCQFLFFLDCMRYSIPKPKVEYETKYWFTTCQDKIENTTDVDED